MVNGNQLLKMHNKVPSTVLVQGALSLLAELHIIIYCRLYCYKLCGLADHSVVESVIACSRYDFDSLFFFKIKLTFLPVGHTHEDIDQMFSRFFRFASE